MTMAQKYREMTPPGVTWADANEFLLIVVGNIDRACTFKLVDGHAHIFFSDGSDCPMVDPLERRRR